jgi:hypothetical protein
MVAHVLEQIIKQDCLGTEDCPNREWTEIDPIELGSYFIIATVGVQSVTPGFFS